MNGCMLCCAILGCFFVILFHFLLNSPGLETSDAASGNLKDSQSQLAPKSRPKRYLNLPDGASVQLVYCFLLTAIGTNQYFTLGLSLGLAWEVPANLGKFIREKAQPHRRDKRSLYPKISVFIDKLGYNGGQCIKRFLCETNLRKGEKLPLIEKLFQVIFTYQNGAAYEPMDMYDAAHSGGECSQFKDTCPITLFLS